ncbi:hypothetical protein HID58_038188, partial [Brassica napus]
LSLDERRFDVSFGDSCRRRLLRCLSSATSPPVALVGDLFLGGSPRGDRFVGSLSRWVFSSKLSLGGSNRSFHLKSKGEQVTHSHKWNQENRLFVASWQEESYRLFHKKIEMLILRISHKKIQSKWWRYQMKKKKI